MIVIYNIIKARILFKAFIEFIYEPIPLGTASVLDGRHPCVFFPSYLASCLIMLP